MRLVTLRLETILKENLQEMAENSQRIMSDIIRDLVDLGIGYQQESPVIIKGVFGITRSFSKLRYGDEGSRISVYLNEEQIGESLDTFNGNENSAIREALRLGFIMLNADKVSFTNPHVEVKPLKDFMVNSFQNNRAQKALENLKDKEKMRGKDF
ncbi:hypothetical protein GF319_12475 [Candidatus Bathyarchaeota archaeon]|jgi:hypothetical protein|nr:hypothetical protein [Candidatus Bathyarchaeota archaeon]